MPTFSGGGATFNGGTITTELVADTGSGTALGIEIQGTRTSEHDAFRIDYPHSIVALDSDGGYLFQTDDQMLYREIANNGTALSHNLQADTNCSLNVRSNFGGGGGRGGVFLADGTNATHIATDDGFVYVASGATVAQLGNGILLTSPGVPATASLSSGTGNRLSTTTDVRTFTPVTFNPTAGAAATCAVAIGYPPTPTYVTLWTETEPAGVALDGTIHGLQVYVPAGWYLKLTVTNATIGTTTYY